MSDICWHAYMNEFEKVQECLSSGSDIEARDRDERTPLINSVSGTEIGSELTAFLMSTLKIRQAIPRYISARRIARMKLRRS